MLAYPQGILLRDFHIHHLIYQRSKFLLMGSDSCITFVSFFFYSFIYEESSSLLWILQCAKFVTFCYDRYIATIDGTVHKRHLTAISEGTTIEGVHCVPDAVELLPHQPDAPRARLRIVVLFFCLQSAISFLILQYWQIITYYLMNIFETSILIVLDTFF